MSDFWKGKKVLVTGGTGFIGSFTAEQLLKKTARVTLTTKSGDTRNVDHIKKDVKILKVDLANPADADKAAKNQEIILHLASKVAGIQFNINHPATMFSENILISKNVIESARKNHVERILITSSACVYPRFCTIPTPENEGFINDPEPTNLGYGWAKRVSELLARFYSDEFGMKIAIVRPYNCYGPRDDFNPKTSHVIPGLIKRIYDGENPLTVWGSGQQSRSFLYVEDFARGLIEATEKYAIADPVNIGTDEEVTIGKLANLIVKLSGKKIVVKFDKTKPDGQPRRNCDIRKAKEKFNYKAEVPLEKGLKETIKWYEQHLLS